MENLRDEYQDLCDLYEGVHEENKVGLVMARLSLNHDTKESTVALERFRHEIQSEHSEFTAISMMICSNLLESFETKKQAAKQFVKEIDGMIPQMGDSS